MRRVVLLVVLSFFVITPIAGASSETLSEPWHPAREYLVAIVSNTESGSLDVWHPAVDELQASFMDIAMRLLALELRKDVSADEARRRAQVFESEASTTSFYKVEFHPDKDWAIVRTNNIFGETPDIGFAVALYESEWRVVMPVGAESWADFDTFADWAAYESTPRITERAEKGVDDAEWTRLDENWRYRNATIRRDPFLPTFLVEFQRTGPAVQMAMFTVTLYDSADRIVTTGNGTVLATNSGSIRTVEFLLRGDAEKAAKFRLQLDAEL